MKKDMRSHFISIHISREKYVLVQCANLFLFLISNAVITVLLEPLHEWYDSSNDSQGSRAGHVSVAPRIMAIKSVIFCQDNAGTDKDGDTDIIETGDPLEQMIITDARQRVPHRRAHETFAGRAEKHSEDDTVDKGSFG